MLREIEFAEAASLARDPSNAVMLELRIVGPHMTAVNIHRSDPIFLVEHGDVRIAVTEDKAPYFKFFVDEKVAK